MPYRAKQWELVTSLIYGLELFTEVVLLYFFFYTLDRVQTMIREKGNRELVISLSSQSLQHKLTFSWWFESSVGQGNLCNIQVNPFRGSFDWSLMSIWEMSNAKENKKFKLLTQHKAGGMPNGRNWIVPLSPRMSLPKPKKGPKRWRRSSYFAPWIIFYLLFIM